LELKVENEQALQVISSEPQKYGNNKSVKTSSLIFVFENYLILRFRFLQLEQYSPCGSQCVRELTQQTWFICVELSPQCFAFAMITVR
jgi:hypothetical protein